MYLQGTSGTLQARSERNTWGEENPGERGLLPTTQLPARPVQAQQFQDHPRPASAAVPGAMAAPHPPAVGGRAWPVAMGSKARAAAALHVLRLRPRCHVLRGRCRGAASLGTAGGTGNKARNKAGRAPPRAGGAPRGERAGTAAARPRPRQSPPAPSPRTQGRRSAGTGRGPARHPHGARPRGLRGRRVQRAPGERGAASVTEEESLRAQGAHALHVHGAVLHRGAGARLSESAALRADAH